MSVKRMVLIRFPLLERGCAMTTMKLLTPPMGGGKREETTNERAFRLCERAL